MAEKKYSIWPAIVVLVVAFGVPTAIGTIEVRIARNAHAETAAIEQMEAIVKAESAYHAAHQSYSETLEALRDLPKADTNYSYHYIFLSPDKYSATAEPNEPGKHGRRYFYVDQTGVARYEVMKTAGAASGVVPSPEEKK